MRIAVVYKNAKNKLSKPFKTYTKKFVKDSPKYVHIFFPFKVNMSELLVSEGRPPSTLILVSFVNTKVDFYTPVIHSKRAMLYEL